MRYRYRDKQEVNQHGQTLGYALWMGGPTLTYIKGVLCDDGQKRTWFRTGEPDTWFSTPGYVHVKGKRVKGWVTASMEPNGAFGLWKFHFNKP